MTTVTQDGTEIPIAMPEIISALSFALDLTEGANPGHALRTTLLGMQIAMALGMSQEMLASLYYALQLKDVGCSSNAARMAHLFGGDDRRAKALLRLTDWSGLLSAGARHTSLADRVSLTASALKTAPAYLRTLWSIVLPGAGVARKLRRLSTLSAEADANTRTLISLRCDRGAAILRKLRMSDLACESVAHLDEHWDGGGYPFGLQGERIPLLARISAVAQALDIAASAHGTESSIRLLQRRSGTWFDPEIVQAAVALHKAGYLWQACEPHCPVERSRDVVVSLSPETPVVLDTDQIDAICEAFADVVDAKSPFTFRHSIGVTEIAGALAEDLHLPPDRRKLLRRAALLHDLGKLGVPNSILDKPSPLTAAERAIVLQHPGMSRTILSRVPALREVARISGEHHERLDGSGYPDGLTGEHLGLESRVLAMADCFAALAEERPYRSPLPVKTALSILRDDTPAKLDAGIFCALENVVRRWDYLLPAAFYEPGTICAFPQSAALPPFQTVAG